MRIYTSLAVALSLMLISQATGLCGNNSELFFIRRAFICELGVPPSVSEIEWLMTYQTNTLTSGIQHVLDVKYGKDPSLYKTFLFNFYTNTNNRSILLVLTKEQRDIIVKYQSGNLNFTTQDAKSVLVKSAIACLENSEDPIDYLFLCLCGRYTNTQEYDICNKIFKNATGTDYENLMLVLECILASKYFTNY